MLAFVRIILLALAVCVANAYCACADAGVPAPARQSCCGTKARTACHGAAPAGEAPAEPGRHAHNCGHCTGSITTDTAAKTVVPPLADTLFVVAADTVDGVTPLSVCHLHEHAGLSPPVPSPTLLNLACSLNN